MFCSTCSACWFSVSPGVISKTLNFLFLLIPVVSVIQLWRRSEEESESIPCSLISKDLLARSSSGFLSEINGLLIFSDGCDVADWSVLVGMPGNSLKDAMGEDVTDCASLLKATEEPLLLSIKSGVVEVMKFVVSS